MSILETHIELHREALLKLEAIKKEMATEKTPQRKEATEKLATQYADVMQKLLTESVSTEKRDTASSVVFSPLISNLQ